MRHSPESGLPRRAGTLAILALVTGLVLTSSAAAASLLGSAGPATASCPADCLVEARVTGFQMSIEGSKRPFVIPAQGRITSWSIRLGAPVRSEIKGFNRRFGESKARLSILKPQRWAAARPREHRYKLVRQSPVERLRSFFGSTADFSLARPLKVNRGQVVALTLPTWAPAFSTGQTKRSTWRASRAPTDRRGNCVTEGGFANIRSGAPQQKLASERAYGCAYRGARLLYWATFKPVTGR